MCGISGFFSFGSAETVDFKTLLAMTNSMAHRGPDDSGCALLDGESGRFSAFKTDSDAIELQSAPVGLGHRRLSILDLSVQGHQPMSTSDGVLWMVYNGEVYNYLEIKEELLAKGYTFTSTTDSEVVLKSYQEWGTDCFRRFNGMWAIAIYNMHNGQLILSRDRYGQKPLYYFRDGNKLVFASEIKAVLKYPGIPKEPNPRKLVNYAGRHYRYVDNDDESFFKDIYSIPRSSFMVIKPNGETYTSTYWELSEKPLLTEKYSEREIVEQFRELLDSAVNLRLRSDVPVGSMLSGGMDSTSVTCLAAKHNPHFKTFSSVTGTGYYDESEYIQAIIDHTEVDSQFIYPKPADLFGTLKEMLTFHDEPVCTVTWFSLYLIVAEIVKSKIPVILTGHGGDELLGGYWDHYHYNYSDIRNSGGDDSYERESWMNNHHRDPEEYGRELAYIAKLRQDKSVELDKYSKYLKTLSAGMLKSASFREFHSPFKGDLSRRLYLEMLFETVPASLRAEDRNCMAFSIENRVPFLDYRLAEFCFRLPNDYKIRNGLGKWLLREATEGILPDKVRLRKDKTGHNAPFDEWIRNDNRRELEELLDRKSYINREVYDHAELKNTFREHLDGANHYMYFWHYINLNLWYDQFFS